MKQYFPDVLGRDFSHEIEIKRSRFITYIGHTPDKSSSQEFIEQINVLHTKANHNCWARIAGPRHDTDCWHSNDDGEPKGTAGKPMLNVLQHSELCEVTVVVTRYFGGIKLGAGGLVRAYSLAVKDALPHLPTAEKILKLPFNLELPHALVSDIERIMAQCHAVVETRDWGEKQIRIEGVATEDQLSTLRDKLTPFIHMTHYQDGNKRW